MGTIANLAINITGHIGGLKSALGEAQSTLSDVGKNLTKIGKSMSLAITAPLVGIGVAGFKAATELNASMANVASLGVATARVNELKASVQNMAIATGKTTDDLAGGLYQVVSAFGDTADTAKILEINAKSAAAGVASTVDAINLTSAVTKAYGDTSVAAVQHASDLALKTVELGQTTFPDLASSIGKVTTMSNNLGISQEELFAVFSSLTGVIPSSAEVATGFRGILQSLQAPTDTMSKLLTAMGYSSGQAMIKQLGLAGTVQLITAAAQKSGLPLQNFIGSVEGQTAAMALAGSQSGKYASDLVAMSNAAGKTDEAFKAQTEGINKLGFMWEQAKIKLTVFLQKMTDAAGPVLMSVADMLMPLGDRLLGLADTFTKIDPATQRWIIGLLAAAAAAGPLLIALGTLLPILGTMGVALGALVSPIGLVVAGLAALAYYNFDSIKDFASTTLAGIQAAAPLAGTALSELVAQLTGFGIEAHDTTEGIEAFVTALTGSQSTAAAVGSAISAIGLQIATFVAMLSTVAAGPLANLQDSFASFSSTIGAQLAPQFTALGAAVQALWAAAQPALTALAQLIGIGLGVTAITAINLLSATFQSAGSMIGAMVSQATATINLLATTVSGMTQIITALLNGDFAGAWAGAQTIISGFATYAQTTLSNLGTTISGTLSIIATTISSTATALGFPEISAQIDAIQAKVSSGWLSIKESITATVAAFKWSDYVHPLTWPVTTTVFSWKDWVASKLTWPTEATVFAWKDWLSKLTWPDISWPGWKSFIKDFPGWPDIKSMVAATISSIPGVNTVSSTASSIVDTVSSYLPGKALGTSYFEGGLVRVGEAGRELVRIGHNAGGTDSWQGGWSWVGEKGPELVNLPRGAQVMSHTNSMKMVGHLAEGTTSLPAGLSSSQMTGFASFINSQKENTKAIREQTKAQRDSINDLKSALQNTSGLFHTSEVTQKQLDLAKLGIPQNFADDWVRHLTDNVLNGAHWKDADIKDAALRAGIDPMLPAKVILDMVKDKWNDSSLFAGGKNLDLINQDAVKKQLADQAAAKSGQQSIMALFGIQPDQVAGQAAALGGQLRLGIDQGLAGAPGGLGTGIIGNLSAGITVKTMQPVATKIMSGVASSLSAPQGDDAQQIADFGGSLVAMINAQLDKKGLFDQTGHLILTKVASSWGDGTQQIDMISSIASVAEKQLLDQNVIDSLKTVGAHMVKIVFAGFDEEASGQNWTGAVKVGKTGSSTAGNALGTSYSAGGMRWVGETGRELMYVPRGAGIVANPQAEAMAAGGGVTVNMPGAVIRDERDVVQLAYAVADIIERRRR